MHILPGDYHSLGANWDGEGVNFALFSAHAEKVELCLFDETGQVETARYSLPQHTHDIWHGYLPGLQPGTCYGYRVYGPYDPGAGHRFNHHKLLLDPYARQLAGEFRWDDAHFGYCKSDTGKGRSADPEQDLTFDSRDNSTAMPKCVVTASQPGTNNEHRPVIPWRQTILYETHVRGFTLRHPDVPELQRGTFAGLGQQAVIDYLKALGITSIELLPSQAFIDEHFLNEKGLRNYWGYNSLSYFAPHTRYLSTNDVGEFRQMVDRFHQAGLEVILDVVYNHTCESGHLGPTLSFRGIDNASYYRLQSEQPRYYINDTGCGNTLNIGHPRVLQLVMDSLRYWYAEMGVDGFRFDLATVLGREDHGFNRQAGFFQAIGQDPTLCQAKLIAEPWDIGPGGYQLGHFPAGWSEWNDDYRDAVRRFWLREPGCLPSFARRLHGSSDIFEQSGRKPFASINYITSHDGFTLRDLVSYRKRHNEANGEHNRDGHRENFSDNFGVEGASDDPLIEASRRLQQRNLLTTLMMSQGVPMLLAGDELGRSQQGNNNAYCQDNELNWLDWQSADWPLQAFVRRLINLRIESPALSCAEYIHHAERQQGVAIQWLNSDGQQMREEHWLEHHNYLLGYLLMSPVGDSLIIFNNHLEPRPFRLPEGEPGKWQWLVDTSEETGEPAIAECKGSEALRISGHSIALLFRETHFS